MIPDNSAKKTNMIARKITHRKGLYNKPFLALLIGVLLSAYIFLLFLSFNIAEIQTGGPLFLRTNLLQPVVQERVKGSASLTLTTNHDSVKRVSPLIQPGEAIAIATQNRDAEDRLQKGTYKKRQEHQTYTSIARIVEEGEHEVTRLSPPFQSDEGMSIQLDEELMIYVGGYTHHYNRVANLIQIFNITSQKWLDEREMHLPPQLAETHIGLAFDQLSRMIYIVSGQKGPACAGATTASARIDLDTGEYQMLPPLPRPRYSPNVQIVVDPNRITRKYLHVFGGASEARDERATNHWRLIIDESPGGSLETNIASWEELEAVPDGGTHGTSFQHAGYIYTTAFCTMDQSKTEPVTTMAACQRHAIKWNRQLIHHAVDSGFTFRYPVAPGHKLEGDQIQHWERLADMPFPICHSSGIFALDRFMLLGGGTGAKQVKQGSVPTMQYYAQIYDPVMNTWDAKQFAPPSRDVSTLFKANWYDHGRNKLFVGRPAKSFFVAHLTVLDKNETKSHSRGEVEALRRLYLQETRGMAISIVTNCIRTESSGNVTLFTFLDKEYDEVRGTWNKRIYDRQFPDVVTFPNNTGHISTIVKCARRSGYRVCGRNGKHSFEGDTCTYGIVIDVKRFDSFEVLDQGKGIVRIGAGMFLGRMAVELASYNLTLPMGHCASVGITGLILVGGQGLLSRKYGLTSDFVESIEMVDPKGDVIKATATNQYSDLLWLARGGGSSVLHFPGIITSIQFADIPSIDSRQASWTKFQLTYNATVENAEKLLVAWQDFYQDPDNVEDTLLFNRLTVEPWLWMQRVKKNTFAKELYLVGYFYGNDQEHDEFIDRIMPKLEAFLETTEKQQPERYDDLAFHRMLGGVENNYELASGVHGWDLKELPKGRQMNRWKGYSAVASQKVPARAFRALAESIYHKQPYSRRYVEFKPLGGAIQNLGPNETAFGHRNAIWWSLSSHWWMSRHAKHFTDEVLKSSREGHARFTSAMGSAYAGGYAGYIDHSNSTGRDLQRYYGRENAGRIWKIKQDRDPNNIFQNYLPADMMANAPFDLRGSSRNVTW